MTDLAAFLSDLTAEYEATRATFDRDDLVRLLIDLRELAAGVRGFAQDVTRDLLALADEKRWVTPGLGEVTVRKQTKRTAWKHAELLPVLIARIMDERETLYDAETGELLPYVQIGHNLTARLRECVSFGAGKVTGLRALGIDEEEFCTVTPDGYGIELPPRDV